MLLLIRYLPFDINKQFTHTQASCQTSSSFPKDKNHFKRPYGLGKQRIHRANQDFLLRATQYTVSFVNRNLKSFFR